MNCEGCKKNGGGKSETECHGCLEVSLLNHPKIAALDQGNGFNFVDLETIRVLSSKTGQIDTEVLDRWNAGFTQ